MTERIENIDILLTERTMPSKGSTSSNAINDTIKELSHDLVGIQDQWNNRLVPLTESLPAGSPSSEVDAFTNGLDGVNMYVDAAATTTYRASYYSTGASRPNTVYEQFESVYESLTTLEEDLENQLNNLARTASQVAITDNANIYTATNVETALAEVMVKVNSISLATLGSVNQNILPRSDVTYDIGSAVKRWKAGYFGPTALHLVATPSEAGGAAKDYTFSIDTSGYLLLKDGSTNIATINNLQVDFAVSGVDELEIHHKVVEVQNDLAVIGQFYSPTLPEYTPGGTTQLVNWESGNIQILDLADATGTVALTFWNPKAGATYVLKIIQDAAVARDITWPSTVQWPDGITPVISTGATAIDIVTLLYDGTSYFANIGQNYS